LESGRGEMTLRAAPPKKQFSSKGEKGKKQREVEWRGGKEIGRKSGEEKPDVKRKTKREDRKKVFPLLVIEGPAHPHTEERGEKSARRV